MKKETAVELIEEKIKFQIKLAKMDRNNNVQWSMDVIISSLEDLYYNECEQAKEMEKQQLKEMYLKGIENYDSTFKPKKQ